MTVYIYNSSLFPKNVRIQHETGHFPMAEYKTLQPNKGNYFDIMCPEGCVPVVLIEDTQITVTFKDEDAAH